MDRFNGTWENIQTVKSAKFTCGYCGEKISSDKAFRARVGSHSTLPFIYICHSCNKPSFIDGAEVSPSASLGNPVGKLPEDINHLYDEIRKSTSVNAYTAAVLAARKLLMHIAVEKGAEENKTFLYYVNYLEANHFTPPSSNAWVDKIRQLGNDANHEIVIMDSSQAKLILTFLEMLLRFIYEFPAIEAEQIEEVDVQ